MQQFPPPKTIAEYLDWHELALGITIDSHRRNQYESSARWIREQTQQSSFWLSVTPQLRELDAQYLRGTGYYLLFDRATPDIVWKPFDSAVDKAFRKNVLLNHRWPQPPEDGWISPDNWFARINDPIRTFIVVKYLDGVPFLASGLEKIAQERNVPVTIDFEAREEGYYAAHIYAKLKGEIFRMPWDTEEVQYSFEVQVTTQLQDVIRPITHPFYVTRRSRPERLATKWQWQFDTDEFRANYLAHTLHHVEGLIVDVRDRAGRRI